MQGVVFPGNRVIDLREFPDPTPGPGEVVIEIKASGMCGSDLKFYRDPKGQAGGAAAMGLPEVGPIIGGHEPCGVVAAVGQGVTEKQAVAGRRVIPFRYLSCGVCEFCRAGWLQHCVEGVKAIFGVTAHGAHAKYMKCPADTLVTLPDELSFAAGAAIACGTGTAWGGLQRLGIQGQHTIAIFGQGPVGLSATQLASALGARVIAIDPSPERLARAKEFGAGLLIDPTQTGDVVAAIKEATHGLGSDLSLDASGAAQARVQAARCVRTFGKACYIGEGGTVTLDVSSDLLRRQVTIVASWTMSMVGLEQCARYIADRKIDVDAQFTHRWPLSKADEAYHVFDEQTAGKGVFLN